LQASSLLCHLQPHQSAAVPDPYRGATDPALNNIRPRTFNFESIRPYGSFRPSGGIEDAACVPPDRVYHNLTRYRAEV